MPAGPGSPATDPAPNSGPVAFDEDTALRPIGDGELWAPEGTLVAQSRQLGLLIGAEVG